MIDGCLAYGPSDEVAGRVLDTCLLLHNYNSNKVLKQAIILTINDIYETLLTLNSSPIELKWGFCQVTEFANSGHP